MVKIIVPCKKHFKLSKKSLQLQIRLLQSLTLALRHSVLLLASMKQNGAQDLSEREKMMIYMLIWILHYKNYTSGAPNDVRLTDV